MNINELFELLQDNVSDDLTGEITLHKNAIFWSYTLEDMSDVDDGDTYNDEEDENFFFGFDSISNEEKLVEVYHEDWNIIQMTLVEHDIENNWVMGEYKTKQNSITFKIS